MNGRNRWAWGLALIAGLATAEAAEGQRVRGERGERGARVEAERMRSQRVGLARRAEAGRAGSGQARGRQGVGVSSRISQMLRMEGLEFTDQQRATLTSIRERARDHEAAQRGAMLELRYRIEDGDITRNSIAEAMRELREEGRSGSEEFAAALRETLTDEQAEMIRRGARNVARFRARTGRGVGQRNGIRSRSDRRPPVSGRAGRSRRDGASPASDARFEGS